MNSIINMGFWILKASISVLATFFLRIDDLIVWEIFKGEVVLPIHLNNHRKVLLKVVSYARIQKYEAWKIPLSSHEANTKQMSISKSFKYSKMISFNNLKENMV